MAVYQETNSHFPDAFAHDPIESHEPRSATKYFSIRQTLEDIPPPEKCPCCGSETEKALIPYSIQGSKYRVKNKSAPGYKCTDCGAGLYALQTTVALLIKAAALLDEVDDFALRGQLCREATALFERLRESQKPTASV